MRYLIVLLACFTLLVGCAKLQSQVEVVPSSPVEVAHEGTDVVDVVSKDITKFVEEERVLWKHFRGVLDEPVTGSDRVVVRNRKGLDPDFIFICVMADESYTSQLMSMEVGDEIVLQCKYNEEEPAKLNESGETVWTVYDCIILENTPEVVEEQDEK